MLYVGVLQTSRSDPKAKKQTEMLTQKWQCSLLSVQTVGYESPVGIDPHKPQCTYPRPHMTNTQSPP